MILAVIASILLAAAALAAEPAPTVCADPARPCPGFKAHDLSFPLPRDGIARPEVRSAPFYAVILKSGARCRIADSEREDAQRMFAESKVFNARFGCDDDVENNVSYTNVDPKAGFLAVHAGADRAAGEAMLARVKAAGRYSGANLRRMQAVFVFP
jgi:hypothetical protein